MDMIPIRDVWFDDAATSAMGEAFDRACKALRILGPAVTMRETSQSELLKTPKMASAIPPASVSRH